MKKQLIAHNRVPYGGAWVYVQPETGLSISGGTWVILLNKIRDHRRAMGIPIGLGFEDEVEKYLCEHQSSECEDVEENKIRKRPFTLADIVAGTRVFMAQWWNDKKVVPREEAERRASVCVNCPMNVTFQKPCNGLCPELSEVASAIVGAQGTRFDSRLHQCAICQCFLQAAIWVELETQLKVLTPEQRENFTKVPNCWKVNPTSDEKLPT